jgi:hypothetical protein
MRVATNGIRLGLLYSASGHENHPLVAADRAGRRDASPSRCGTWHPLARAGRSVGFHPVLGLAMFAHADGVELIERITTAHAHFAQRPV